VANGGVVGESGLPKNLFSKNLCSILYNLRPLSVKYFAKPLAVWEQPVFRGDTWSPVSLPWIRARIRGGLLFLFLFLKIEVRHPACSTKERVVRCPSSRQAMATSTMRLRYELPTSRLQYNERPDEFRANASRETTIKTIG